MVRTFIAWFGASLLGVVGAFAQNRDLRVIVRNDADEALAYAYLYVNGRAVAVTDSLGEGTIAAGKLAPGDTLGISYVGAESAAAVYDGAMQRRGVWEAVLEEKYRPVIVDDVVVRADVETLYRQSVRKFWMLYRPHTASARFRAETGGRMVEGRVTATHLPGDTSETTYLKRGLYWYHLPLRIDDLRNPDLLSAEQLHDWLHLAFYYPAWELSVALRALEDDAQGGARYGYLGKRDGCRLFRITYPEVHEGEGRYSVQLLVWVGERDRCIRRIETRAVHLDDEETWLHLDASYVLSSIDARTLAFDRIEVMRPGYTVRLGDLTFRLYHPKKR